MNFIFEHAGIVYKKVNQNTLGNKLFQGDQSNRS